jgi:dTDP-4-amino-4,6-dideoxygalactose transaminase
MSTNEAIVGQPILPFSGIQPPTIHFSKSTLAASEFMYVHQAMTSGHLHGDGPFTARCTQLLREALGCPHVLLTPSCTHALELAAMLLDLGPGDDVIMPSFTFPSTATAVVRAGARPIFVDIRTDTLNIDELQVEAAITPRTRCILPVHYNGVGSAMEALLEIAARHNLSIVEDNAHGLFGTYDGKYLGTLGSMGCLSFHGTKNFTCGEGGALLINDPALIDRAETIREKGTNRQAFLQGRVDKYSWVDVGSSFLPSDVSAAILLGQLEDRTNIQDARRQLWEGYLEALQPIQALGVKLPSVPARCQQTWHLFALIVRSPEERTALAQYARRRGVECSFHYQPLHASAAGRRFGSSLNDCPETTSVSERLLRLPLYTDMTEEELYRVTDVVLSFYRINSGP